MGINQDAMMVIKSQLCDRIDHILGDLATWSPRGLADEINDIRQVAQDCGLVPLAELARGLGRSLFGSDASVTIRPFLETMREAAGCERIDQAAAQSFLASISRRLHG
jgi:hypothetical protein